MIRSLARLESPSLAALRIVAGAMFAFHGLQIFGFLAHSATPPAFSQLWFGGLIEIVCGLLVALGLFTRCAALLASGTMAVAYFQFHFKLQFAGFHWLPGVNQGELSVLYCFIFLFIATHGPGPLALDRTRSGT